MKHTLPTGPRAQTRVQMRAQTNVGMHSAPTSTPGRTRPQEVPGHAIPSDHGGLPPIPSNLRHPLPARPNMHHTASISTSSTKTRPLSAPEPSTVVHEIRSPTADASSAITTAVSTIDDGHIKEPRKTTTAAAKRPIEESVVPRRKKAKRESRPPVRSDGGNSAGSGQAKTTAVGGSGSSTTTTTKAILSSGKTQEDVIDLTGDDDD